LVETLQFDLETLQKPSYGVLNLCKNGVGADGGLSTGA